MDNSKKTVNEWTRDYAKEDAIMIARSIMSGKNACGTLQDAVATGNQEFFERMAYSVLRVRHEQLQDMSESILELNKRNTYLRRVVELIAQNIGGAVTVHDPEITKTIGYAIGRPIE